MNNNFNYQSQFSATSAMKNYVITTSSRLPSDDAYQKICQIIYKLVEGGTTFVGKGYCISMSDIVYTMLRQNNIPCKIVECHLSLENKVGNQIYAVGFDGLKDDPTRSDTHVVVVTETQIPMVIDVSIAHLLPNNLQGVIDELTTDNHGIFANITSNEVNLTYQHKKNSSIPLLHQRSITDRIQTDVNIFSALHTLKIIIGLALFISFINASRGLYDFYQVYGSDNNNWGPSAIVDINNRLDSIDKKISTLDKK